MLVARLTDMAFAPQDPGVGCIACPHPVTGPSITASGDVMVNGLGVLRIGDMGNHFGCCAGVGIWFCVTGSGTVTVNDISVVRFGDLTAHCKGAPGTIVTSSADVDIGG